MKIMVINGPSLNMLGIREKEVQGTEGYDSLVNTIQDAAQERSIEVEVRQSNHEGTLIDWLQEAYFNHYDGVVINPGGYTHTSVALRDAIKAVSPLPVVEVHISDISSREEFRRTSLIEDVVAAQVKGHGFRGYIEAVDMITVFRNM